MAGVFHVEFGINETQLTQALEIGNFALAEQLIRENTVPSYLDEGCYHRTSLYIVLCGEEREITRLLPRNLYLAKLLVENGANINLRVPTTYFGAEYMGPGKTPLQLLVDFYNDLTKDHFHSTSHDAWSNLTGSWQHDVDVVIGLNKKPLFCKADVIEHVEKLTFLMLSNGADPNIPDEKRMSPLHKLAIHSHDISLFQLLCENGADLNAVDCFGNTPLLSLCDVTCSELFDILDELSPLSNDSFDDTSASLAVKSDFLHYLLSKTDLHIDGQNKYGQTALFHCVVRGDVSSCSSLLRRGADPSLRGLLWETRRKKRRMSPLFACFLSIPIQRSLGWQRMQEQLISASKQYSHLVDMGFFTKKGVVAELQEYLEEDFPEFSSNLQLISDQVIHMMFGQTTATLKQLTARTIFRKCLMENSNSVSELIPTDVLKQRFPSVELNHHDVYEEYVNFALNTTVLQALIRQLHLPRDSLINFQAELLLHKLACKVSRLKFLPPDDLFYNDDSDGSYKSGDSITSSSTDEGDSDLEYW